MIGLIDLVTDTAAPLLHLGWLPVSLIGEIMLWIAALLTLVTGWDYLNVSLRHATSVSDAGPEAVRD